MKEPQKTRKRALPQPTGTSKSSDGEVEASWVSEEWGAPGFLGNKGVGWGPIEGSGRRSFRRRGKGVEHAGRSARGSMSRRTLFDDGVGTVFEVVPEFGSRAVSRVNGNRNWGPTG